MSIICLAYIEPAGLKPLRLVVNAGNGAAGHVIDAMEARVVGQKLPVEFIKVHHEPDGSFPNIAHLPAARKKGARCTWTPVTG